MSNGDEHLVIYCAEHGRHGVEGCNVCRFALKLRGAVVSIASLAFVEDDESVAPAVPGERRGYEEHERDNE